eukprot:gb/GECH01005582.1/.p1 GENE.gb/GECH01005582.1/~~gb/GECH01005582.1/.p1  ORF type:complete len:120 (+),score=31.19 gb/GECH01005582.1/:1-360(+)
MVETRSINIAYLQSILHLDHPLLIAQKKKTKQLAAIATEEAFRYRSKSMTYLQVNKPKSGQKRSESSKNTAAIRFLRRKGRINNSSIMIDQYEDNMLHESCPKTILHNNLKLKYQKYQK